MQNKNFTDVNNFLQIGQTFISGGLGIISNRERNDGFVLIEKHQDADIVCLIDDPLVEYLTCILVNYQSNVYIIDTSKKSECGIKLQIVNDTIL